MIPNDFGIIRQADHNLFAVLFPPLTDISEYEVEIIHPEYIDGYSVNYGTGTVNAAANLSYADVDISNMNFEYVLVPCSVKGAPSNNNSGLNIGGVGNAFNSPLSIIRPGASSESASCYNLFSVKNYTNVVISCSIDFKMPIIGFRRHRSDHVNPLGVIQPLDPGALEPDDPVPDPEDQEER